MTMRFRTQRVARHQLLVAAAAVENFLFRRQVVAVRAMPVQMVGFAVGHHGHIRPTCGGSQPLELEAA